ncbi:MAG: beta-N-acetylhexosaminidase [Planctomycetes bacterium]|nr:beta-N-acetylhexosaminidase [Planctomycetota bacterium]
MKSITAFAIAVLCLFAIAHLSCASGWKNDIARPKFPLAIIPQPRIIEKKDLSHAHLHKEWKIVLESTSSEKDRYSAQLLKDDLKDIYNVDVRIAVDDTLVKNDNNVIILGVPARDKSIMHRTTTKGVFVQQWLGNEGYVMDISPDYIFVLANDSAGVYYGVQTLRQSLYAEAGEVIVPPLLIRDTPVYKRRGFQLDISDNPFPKKEYLEIIVSTLGFYKFNMLSLYTEPQAFRFSKYPKLSRAEALTPEDLSRLSKYCALNNIELVGNLQSLTHWDKVLSSTDTTIAEDGENPTALSPMKEKTYELLSDLYSEIVPAYKSEFFNVNCEGYAEAQAGIDSSTQVSAPDKWINHINRLNKILLGFSKQMMVWSDMPLKAERLIPLLPNNIIVMNYSDSPKNDYGKLIDPFKNQKISQFICPSVCSTNRAFPMMPDAFRNIRGFITKGAEANIEGMMVCGAWHGAGEDWMETEWFPVAWASECAWIPDGADEKYFKKKFTRSFYGAGDEEFAKIAEYLYKPAELLNFPDDATGIFWDDPFNSRFHLTVPDFYERLKDTKECANNALKLIELIKNKACRRKDNLDYLAFATKRWQFLVDKYRTAHNLMSKYREFYSEWRDVRHMVLMKLGEVKTVLNTLENQLKRFEADYTALYSRIYLPGIKDEVMKRFEGMAKIYREKQKMLAHTAEDFPLSGKIPEPAELDFQEKELSNRIIRLLPILPATEIAKIPVWWNNDWQYRLMLNAELPLDTRNASAVGRMDYPLEITINFSELLKETERSGVPAESVGKEFDKNSVRMIEETTKGQVDIPCQFDPGNNFNTRHNAIGNLVWIAGGDWKPGTARRFYIYFDALKNGPKKQADYNIKGLKTYDKKGSKWVENERMKVEINPKGARISQWLVKKSGEQIVAENEGFFTAPGDKEFLFTLEANGPIMVRYRAESKDGAGARRTFNFFHNLPMADIMFSRCIGKLDNYDNLSSINKHGRFLFSNYFNGKSPKQGEKMLSETAVGWAAKLLPEGLTFGFMSPDNNTALYVSSDRLGVDEDKTSLSHFIIFADKTRGDEFNLLHRLSATYNLIGLPRIFRGNLESNK